jgi:uncharacterized protein YecE (DUF72 family)
VVQDFKRCREELILKIAIISANNHYVGFGPMTARMFEEMIHPDIKKVCFPISDYKITEFHGRNINGHYRYNYLYNKETKIIDRKIKKLKDQTKKLRIYFNNHYGEKAVDR